MAVRLGDRVIRGEIFNTAHYSVFGWIELRGRKHPIHLSLTGDCDPDLKGRHVRFTARDAEPLDETADVGDEPEEVDEGEGPGDLDFLAVQQIGPTGTMTAARQVKVADCPVEELYRRCELGEPPPVEWKRCLYLEWFSQNGRVVVEMPDPVIEFVEDEEKPDGSAPGGAKSAAAADGLAAADPADSATAADEAGGEGPLAEGWDEPDDEEEDTYNLLPDGLQEQFDSAASEIDRAVNGGGDDSQLWHEMELMDDLIEGGPGIELVHIFDGPIKLPRPEQVESEEEAEASLKTVLAQMALYGIALDVCKHYTPRETYRLLVEKICPGETAYPELRGTGWVQHFSTSDFCPECEAEFEREFEESEQNRKEDGGPEPPKDDWGDVPF